jgi:hypothetical protein
MLNYQKQHLRQWVALDMSGITYLFLCNIRKMKEEEEDNRINIISFFLKTHLI